nr:hypothetical protein [Kibdelosporangium sp. MJ126-NF4]
MSFPQIVEWDQSFHDENGASPLAEAVESCRENLAILGKRGWHKVSVAGQPV